MRVELLVVPACPNEALAFQRLRQALDEAGHSDTPIAVVALDEDTVGSAPAFAGSPTILIDGADPFAELATPGPGLSCRLYPSASGPAGAPSPEALQRIVAARG